MHKVRGRCVTISFLILKRITQFWVAKKECSFLITQLEIYSSSAIADGLQEQNMPTRANQIRVFNILADKNICGHDFSRGVWNKIYFAPANFSETINFTHPNFVGLRKVYSCLFIPYWTRNRIISSKKISTEQAQPLDSSLFHFFAGYQQKKNCPNFLLVCKR